MTGLALAAAGARHHHACVAAVAGRAAHRHSTTSPAALLSYRPQAEVAIRKLQRQLPDTPQLSDVQWSPLGQEQR